MCQVNKLSISTPVTLSSRELFTWQPHFIHMLESVNRAVDKGILTSWGYVWWYTHLLKAYTHILMGIIVKLTHPSHRICTFLFTITAMTEWVWTRSQFNHHALGSAWFVRGLTSLWCLSTPKFSLTPTGLNKNTLLTPLWFYHKSSTGPGHM